MNKLEILNQMSLLEKAKLLCGYKNMETHPIERLNIRSLLMSDGPSGVRRQSNEGSSLIGLDESYPTTSFPSGNNLASTWNLNLVNEVATKIAKECKHFGIDMLLAPAINIRKNPLCSRNFEYYSEDPLLAGKVALEYVTGIENNGVYACIKHFACNNNETYRFIGDSVVDERALREIYLKPFEMAIKEGKPHAVMTAYNKVNGTHASENKHLLKDILENEWGFNGISITDWGGLKDRVDGLKAGTTIEMPGMINHNINLIVNAVNNNLLDIEVVDKEVLKILNLIHEKEQIKYDFNESYETALKCALESAVLLENDGILPLTKDKKYLVIGDLFERIRYQGSGSSLINPFKLKTHIEAFNEYKISYEYEKGYIGFHSNDGNNNELVQRALEKAKEFDTILFYGGLTNFEESEGSDREHIKLAKNQEYLISELGKLNKKIVFVMFGGNAIDITDIKDKFNAILYIGLAGSATGEATTKLLFGDEVPSGKLTITWPRHYEDVFFGENFLKNPIELYQDSIYVGYRYYTTKKVDVLYPFGYGLSYSKVESKIISKEVIDNQIKIGVNVKNIGNFDSKFVIEIYSTHLNSNIGRPSKILAGFEKVFLKKNEEKNIDIIIDIDSLKIYDVNSKQFILEQGEYELSLSNDVLEIVDKTTIHLDGIILDDDTYKLSNIEKLTPSEFCRMVGYDYQELTFEKGKYTLETPIYMYETLFGKIFKRIASNVGIKDYKKALKKKNKIFTIEEENKIKTGLFVSKMMPYNCLRSICFSSSGLLKYNMACGILDLVNNKPIKGVIKMLKKDKVIDYDEKN